MSKVLPSALPPLAALALAVAGHAARAMPAGPFAARCDAAAQAPALLVRVSGFKTRTGTLRVQTYGGDPARYFDKGSYLKRIDLPVPAAGMLDVCVPVPAPGRYAVSVRHDVDGDGRADRADGGGMSGNPRLTLIDLMFRRKPDPARVAIEVARGVRVVPVTLDYLVGASFRPVAG